MKRYNLVVINTINVTNGDLHDIFQYSYAQSYLNIIIALLKTIITLIIQKTIWHYYLLIIALSTRTIASNHS